MRYLLHDVFTSTVSKIPKKIAITTEEGRDISYQELNTLASKFSNFFEKTKKNIREQPYVGILSAVNPESIASVLGILKIGGTYIPLDEYSPSERLSYIVINTNLDIVVTDATCYESHLELFDLPQIKKVVIIGDKALIKNPTNKCLFFENILECSELEPKILNQVSDDLAYILHSSGSTGVPKGIMLTHRNARTFIDWMQKEFQLNENDRVMSRAPFKFDLSIFDIFNTFKAGATLICYDWNRNRDGDEKHLDYVKLMEKEKATILYTTPSTFISLLNRGKLAEAKLSLREIMYAGEPFPVPQLRRLHQSLPNTKIANIYGPTETNIITYYWINDIPDDNSSVPLGFAVDDTEILVVSEDMKRICQTNEIGELWCRGGTVTVGYLGLEEKTKQSLVRSPFHKYPAYFWKTGDYGFLDEKGLLHYNGRKDHMVKVKGYRIEIGEVETAISSYKTLDEFAVVAVPDEKYGNRLFCYFSLLKNQNINIPDIIEFLKNKLPEYMIPYKFLKKDILPKTSSGKIDRVLLAKQSLSLINNE